MNSAVFHNRQGLKGFVLILMLCVSSHALHAQFSRMDSLGSFYVIKHKLVWEKYYPLDDKEALDEALKANEFTSDLDILRFTTSTITKPYKLIGNNLPEYAQHDYKAFLTIDFFGDRYRVRVQQINFPDFEEKVYWNGARIQDPRGTLEQYILRQDGRIKRNSVNERVLYTFDTAFSSIFDPMAPWSPE